MRDRGSLESERQVSPGARGRSGWWTGSVVVRQHRRRLAASGGAAGAKGRERTATHQSLGLTNLAKASAKTASAAEPAGSADHAQRRQYDEEHRAPSRTPTAPKHPRARARVPGSCSERTRRLKTILE